VFAAYTILLMLSGVLLIVLGAAVGEQSTGSRVLSIVVGLAFFGYGFYLEFLFRGGEYRIFFYAFVVPIVLVVRTIQARRAMKARASVTAPGREAGPPNWER
jgi:predicted membrane channel-forming protein YqfA (hemolysin III family)